MTEQWNAYRNDGRLTDVILYRDAPIPDGLYHLVVEAIIQHSDGDLLFVQRAHNKPSYPSHWEASAGGSALLGETAEQAIRREVFEETGLRLNHLDRFQTFFNDEHHCYFNCFLAKTDQEKSDVRLQASETAAYHWVPLTELNDFMSSHPIIPRHKRTLQALYLTQNEMGTNR